MSYSGLHHYIDCKVQLDTVFGVYEGIISFVDPVTTKIGLRNAVSLPSYEAELGQQYFFLEDINKYIVLDRQKAKRKDPSAPQPTQVLSKKELVGLLFHDSDSDDDVTESEKFNNVNSGYTSEPEKEYVLVLPLGFENILPGKQFFIDSIDEKFEDAITEISQEESIGVAFEGKNLGRFGKLCIVTISTRESIFMFDICSLKESAFEHGLKTIFQNSTLQKVIHDCRFASDAIFHLYGTNLVNIFDTLVSDLFISKLNRRSVQEAELACDLLHCLQKHLHCDRMDLCIMSDSTVIKEKRQPLDWSRRPLPHDHRDLAIQNVIYLKLLKEKCLKEMFKGFYKTVDSFKRAGLTQINKALYDPLMDSTSHFTMKCVKINTGLSGDSLYMRQHMTFDPMDRLSKECIYDLNAHAIERTESFSGSSDNHLTLNHVNGFSSAFEVKGTQVDTLTDVLTNSTEDAPTNRIKDVLTNGVEGAFTNVSYNALTNSALANGINESPVSNSNSEYVWPSPEPGYSTKHLSFYPG